MLWLYFGLGASIQEEVIFRGLIQSYLERTWSTSVTRLAGRMSPTVCFTAVLFGVIHLDSGPIVVAGALGLGLVAGELRRCSHSLLPAVIVHALFNLPELLWR
ncbi:MAG TPA: CPBP family intramembrane glutamic endopeptidase [Rhizomicrobium sp.]|nr:CPBP family intramembrane glutamic endopeptidase [Rhizomicrobium sp.]